jgi:glutathione S-transferase
MKLFFSPTSPYVRKCLVVADELGIADRIELLPSNAHPIQRDQGVIAANPLGKVPTLITDDGEALYDSRVICEYLNALAGGNLIPAQGHERWRTLTLQALGDGMLDALLLSRYEEVARPEAQRWPAWLDGQLDKFKTSLRALENQPHLMRGRTDLGAIALACAVWYADLRFPQLGWRSGHPAFATWADDFASRPSMKRTWTL